MKRSDWSRVPLKRRTFLRNFAAVGLMPSRIGNLMGGRSSLDQPSALATPSPQQAAWQDLELGMFVHFAPQTWQDSEADDLSTPLSKIDPAGLDTDQWAQTAAALGARYIVFVAKHQGGFCMWQTRTTEYSIRNTPWKGGKGDVLAEVAASCKKYGLKLGAYVSPRDDHFGAATGGICKTPELQAKYDALYREQLTEVWTRYGQLVEIWFDGSSSTPVGDLLSRYQPNAMVFQGPQATIRWVGNEDGFAPYPCWNGIDAALARKGTATALDSDPNGAAWLPSEVDVSIRRPDWFWHSDNASKVLGVDQLISIYYRSVGRGAQLLLNIPANREGLLSEPDCRAAAALGKEIQRRFGKPIAATRGSGRAIILELPSPARMDTVVLQERIASGERVRAYRIEGQAEEGAPWTLLAQGSAIGHKRIQPVPARTVKAVRLIVTEAVSEPVIRTLAVFDTQAAPPADWDAPAAMWSPDLVGEWKQGAFALDLTKQIPVAAQYALRFRPVDGTVLGFEGAILELGGVSAPALIGPSRSRKDELMLDITGLDKSIRISGKVLGAQTGSILLERR
jgi:alpha-L-fucosidase